MEMAKRSAESAAKTIEVTVNGESIELIEQSTISNLLKQLGIGGRAIAVEVNQEVRSADRFEKHVLISGDQIEIVTLVGGG